MEAGTNFFNPTSFEKRDGGKAVVDALLVVSDNNRKLSGILRKDICQESQAMKYNDTYI